MGKRSDFVVKRIDYEIVHSKKLSEEMITSLTDYENEMRVAGVKGNFYQTGKYTYLTCVYW